MLDRKMKKAYIIIAGVVALCVVFMIGFGFYNTSARRAARQLDMGQKYLAEFDYNNAIAVFKSVISIDPKNVEAYLGLAKAYVAVDDYETAMSVLQEGILKSESADLQIYLEELKKEYEMRFNVEPEPEAENEEMPIAEDNERNGTAMTIEEIADADIGSIVTFGVYEQDNDLANGKEPIEWYILDKENNQMTLLSVRLLDGKPYNEEYSATTWESCTLRSWLNDEFYNSAFNDTEKLSIQQETVANEHNPFYETIPCGEDTIDTVFLLSFKEIERYFGIPLEKATNPAYNGTIDWEEYPAYCYAQDSRIIAEKTEYAAANGAGDAWWTRTPGGMSEDNACVFVGGAVGNRSSSVDNTNYGVRPVIRLSY